jgi:hypothetical protein
MQFSRRGAELPPQAIFEVIANLYFTTNSEGDSSTAGG